MKKTWLIPILLTTTSLPLVSITSCNKEDSNVINVNLNAGKDWHLESAPFSLEKDITYTLSFDLTKWTEDIDLDIGGRLISFSNQYLPNITSFVFGSFTYTKVDTIEEVGQGTYTYYVGKEDSNYGIFFFHPLYANYSKFNIKFLSDIEATDITVELNRFSGF